MTRLSIAAVTVSALLGVVLSAKPACIKLGLLYPTVKQNTQGEWVIDGGGKRRQLGAVMTIEMINNKTDGFYDDLLPDTQIQYTLRDSKRSAGEATVRALDIYQDKTQVCGVPEFFVGPASSGPTMSVQSVLKIFEKPQMSYSATSGALSDDSVYPAFARTPPTDVLQSNLIATFVKTYLGSDFVTTIGGDDSYSKGGLDDFKKFADAAGVTLLESQTFVTGTLQSNIKGQLQRIKDTGCKLIVTFCQASDLINMLKAAVELGMRGADGYTWIFSELMLGSYKDLDAPFGNEIDAILEGSFSQSPSNGKDITPGYFDLLDRWNAYPATMNASTGFCSDMQDDDGHYLWKQSTDENRSDAYVITKTKPADDKHICSGVESGEAVSSYVPFSVDAVLTFAHAAHALIEADSARASKDYMAKITDPSFSFTGVSGTVQFGPNGDRAATMPFFIYNHQRNGQGFQKMGIPQYTDGKISSIDDTVAGAISKSLYEFASAGDTVVNTKPAGTTYFATPESLGLCGAAPYCSGWGTCSPLLRRCDCDDGYTGEFCQYKTTNPDGTLRCGGDDGHGSLNPADGKCMCSDGRGGSECEAKAEDCPTNPGTWKTDNTQGCCAKATNDNVMLPYGSKTGFCLCSPDEGSVYPSVGQYCHCTAASCNGQTPVVVSDATQECGCKCAPVVDSTSKNCGGANCQLNASKFDVSNWSEGSLLTIVNIALAGVTFALLLFTMKNAKGKVIRFSSPLFCYIMLLGILLGFLANLTVTMEKSDGMCAVQIILFELLFALVFGALFAKQYRIMKLMKKRLKVVHVTNKDLLVMLGKMVVFFGAWVAVWLGAGAPKVEERVNPENPLEFYDVCADDQPIFRLLSFVFKFLLVLWGAYVAKGGSSAPGLMNESRHIGMAIYMILLLGMVFLPVLFAIELTPASMMVFTTLGVIMTNFSIILCLFVPKVLIINKFGADGDPSETLYQSKGGNAQGLGVTSSYAGSSSSVAPKKSDDDDEEDE